jgi:hypothetical protein
MWVKLYSRETTPVIQKTMSVNLQSPETTPVIQKAVG